MRDIVQRAREGASEHNCMVRTPTVAKTEATTLKHNCRVRITKAAKTKTTKQKQHTTHDYSIYSSVAISVHCCLHRCSHLAFIPPSCIGVRTLHSSIAARCLDLFVQLSLEQFAAYHDQFASAPQLPTSYAIHVRGQHLLPQPGLGLVYMSAHRQSLVLQQTD